MSNLFKTTLLAVVMFGLMSCGPKATYEYPFQDPSLPNEERVENLLSLLTPEEKVGLMMNKSVSVDRLGIPSYNWWSEACHGVRQDGYTVYPQNIGMAATFNSSLIYDVFTTVSDEARANWNRSEREYNVPMGVINYPGNPELTFWCPNVNIVRDPRWGRGQETLGEDPYLSSVLGVQTVLGMQGNDDKYFKTHACAKHYAVHSGPEPLRHSMDVSVSMRDLWETYLPAFKALVIEADVQEVMCAYQRYEGEPCCMSDRLLIDILRNKWGYEEIVLTDCDAINNFFNKGQHETHPDGKSASVDAVLNGTDLECGRVFQSLVGALEEGLIKESDLDGHLRRTLLGRFELGMFDPAENLPWADLGEDVISSESNDRLAVQTARESIVLLKNDGALPISKNIKKIAVVGPNADDHEMLYGNYGGTPSDNHKRSLLQGIQNALPGVEVIYDEACDLLDEYSTENFLPMFNDGKGAKVEFYGKKSLAGKPDIEKYVTDNLNFSTFGAYGFAEGLNTDNFAVRISGKFVPSYTGTMQYSLRSDNGYKLYVNGRLVEKSDGQGNRRMMRRGAPEYKNIDVVAGKPMDIVVEYIKGDAAFAMLSAQFCRRELVDFSPLVARVSDADAIVVIGGITAAQEGEGGDRADIEFPTVQARLVKAMQTSGKPVVLVNCSGSAMAFTPIVDACNAIVQAWYPGQGGAEALADILFGDYNPSAKLPVTFYKSTADLPDFLDYEMENRTYRYFRGEPLYPFGYGLSYTEYEYGDAKLSKSSVKAGEGVTVTVPVKNVGGVDGEEIVQVYVKSLDNPAAPIKSLKGFAKVAIKAGKSAKVKIELAPESFEYYKEGADGLEIFPGKYQILYGSSSADEDLKALDFEVI